MDLLLINRLWYAAEQFEAVLADVRRQSSLLDKEFLNLCRETGKMDVYLAHGNRPISHTIDAIDKAIRPLLQLAHLPYEQDDGSAFRVMEGKGDTQPADGQRPERSAADLLLSLAEDVPKNAFEGVPTDAASRLDEYLYDGDGD